MAGVAAAVAASGGRLFAGRSGRLWEVCVGLEVHAQLSSATKLFSGSSASAFAAGATPNSAVSLFDAAHPGTLPRPSIGAVSQAVRAAMALRSTLSGASAFERKHYFYADLPLGYQVTQLARPLASGGFLLFDVPLRGPQGKRLKASAQRVARIARLQLEQDSGKSVHTLSREESLVDLNRAGAALVEVVAEPDLRSADEAGAFVRSLAALLRHVGSSAAAMEEGGLRADVNVSVRHLSEEEEGAAIETALRAARSGVTVDEEGALSSALSGAYVEEQEPAAGTGTGPAWAPAAPVPHARQWRWAFSNPDAAQAALLSGKGKGAAPQADRASDRAALLLHPPALGFGERVELKNLSSVRAVVRAVGGEAARQVGLLEEGAAVERESRLFDAATGKSTRLRGKEDAMDYRFLPEPDVAPLLLSSATVRSIAAVMPPLPHELALRYRCQHGLSAYDAAVLVGDAAAPAFFEATLQLAAQQLGLAIPGHGVEATAAAGFAASAAAMATSEPLPPAAQALAKSVANWICNELFGRLHERGEDLTRALASPVAAVRPSVPLVTPSALAELVALVERGDISGRVGKDVLALILQEQEELRLQSGAGAASRKAAPAPEDADEEGGLSAPAAPAPTVRLSPEAVAALAQLRAASEAEARLQPLSPSAIVAVLGWGQLNDRAAITAMAHAAVAAPALAASVDKWRNGQDRVLGAFVARVLEASGGRANPSVAAEVLRELLGPCVKREGHVGRKEKARRAAAAAAASSVVEREGDDSAPAS